MRKLSSPHSTITLTSEISLHFIGTPSHEGYREYTFEHDFVEGVYVRCKAQAGDCMHENAQMTDDPAEHVNLWIGDWHEGTHIVWYDTMTTWNCPACGETFKTRSTKEELRVDICSKCHPFFTGKQKFVDAGGRVDKFKKKFNLD